MSQFDDMPDPYAPVTPWSWVPPSWEEQLAGAVAPPVVDPLQPLQPGIGIPQAALPTGDVEMPPMDMRPDIEMPPDAVFPEVNLGFPTNPDEKFSAEGMFAPPVAPSVPELPPMPDAVSGGDLTPIAPGGNEFALPDPTGAQLTTDQRAQQFASDSPEARARQQMAWMQGRDAEEAKRRSAADLADQRSAVENESRITKARIASRAAMVALDEDGKKLAEQKIDPEKWWADRSTPQKIAGFLAAIVGGLVQGRVGGPNSGLDMINTAIERDIAAQRDNMASKRAELQRRGASIEQMAALDAEDFNFAEKFRVTAISRVQNQITAEMGNYDRNGKTVIELGNTYAGLESLRQQGLVAFQDKNFKDHVEAMTFAAAQQKAQDDHLKSMADRDKTAAETAKLGGGGGARGTDKDLLTPAQLAQMHPTIAEANPELIPTAPMTLKAFSQYLDRAGKGGTAAKTVREGSTDERAREFGVAGLYESDGKTPWLARDKDVAKDLTKKKFVAGRITDIINKVLAIRDETGGESSWGNSDARQRLDVLQRQLVVLSKSGTEGMSSDEDMQKLAGALGAEDIASFRSRAAGLIEGRDNTIEAVNAELNANGYEGPPITFPNMYKGKGKDKPEQESFKKLKNSTTGAVTDPLPGAAWVVPGAKLISKGINALRSEDSDLPDGAEKTQIDAWAKDITLAADKPARDRAIGFLVNLGNSESPAVRAYATQRYREAMAKLGSAE